MSWIYFGVAVLIAFAILETMGLLHFHGMLTLSENIRNLGSRYRITIYAAGVFTGALAIHLFVCCNCFASASG